MTDRKKPQPKRKHGEAKLSEMSGMRRREIKQRMPIKPPQPGKGGRPPDYHKDHEHLAYELALLGATDERMAQVFFISKPTFYKWRKDHPEFSNAINAGRDPADSAVARALFQRAVGYTAPDVHIHVNQFGVVTTVPFERHYPPSETACIFWLKNRRPDLWRDRQQLEVGSGSGEHALGPLLVRGVSEAEMPKAAKAPDKQPAGGEEVA